MSFLHHPDGYINAGGVVMPLADFLQSEPAYPGLGVHAIGFEYVSGGRNMAWDAGGNAIAGCCAADLLDGYLAKVAVYQAAQAGRETNRTAARIAAEEQVEADALAVLQAEIDALNAPPEPVV